MPVGPPARKPGEDWLGIVQKNGMPEFAAAFAANPVLYTSVMSGPCIGVEAIAAVFAATAGGMYDTLAFTHETVDGPKTYLEWEGKALGGTAILTRNEVGLIQSIQIYHRPLHTVLQFSAELENPKRHLRRRIWVSAHRHIAQSKRSAKASSSSCKSLSPSRRRATSAYGLRLVACAIRIPQQ
jgi:hypothetical protein